MDALLTLLAKIALLIYISPMIIVMIGVCIYVVVMFLDDLQRKNK